MEDIRIISGKSILPPPDAAAALAGAKLPKAAYAQVERIFKQQLSAVRMRLRPKAALAIDWLDMPALDGQKQERKKVLMAMLTIGDGISRLIKKAMDQQDLLQAYVLDAMADSSLFAFEQELLPVIGQICKEEGVGILGRFTVSQDVPIDIQKTVFEALRADRTLGLSLTRDFLLLPEKSMSLLFALTEDAAIQNLAHSCESCTAVGCTYRSAQTLKAEVCFAENFDDMTLEKNVGTSQKQISCRKGTVLMEALSKNRILLPAYCGGKGTCGKCRIRFRKGAPPPTPEDRVFFSETQLSDGLRLACKAILQENASICVPITDSNAYQALGYTDQGEEEPEEKHSKARQNIRNEKEESDESQKTKASSNQREKYTAKPSHDCKYAAAIDIGTTTLAFSLVRLSDGRVTDTYTSVNAQRSFGADVLSRMQAANAGKLRQLSLCIQKDILEGLCALLKRSQQPASSLSQAVIAANTVMLHLLRGYSCEGLSRHPFQPVTLSLEELSFADLLLEAQKKEPCPFNPETITVTLLPGISAFVGADITAGLYACDFTKTAQTALFLDLGTNAEMALKKGDTIYTASAAAGPAFEAANIKWGMPGTAGAISRVEIQNNMPLIQTIGAKPPQGICGTGVISAAASLLSAGLLLPDGRLKEPYFSGGYPLAKTPQGETIVLLQRDIREIQMAKAAIRAGLEILLLRSGTAWEEIGTIYLAGGFGYYLDLKDAAAMGIMPQAAAGKAKAIGNAALKGAVHYIKNQDQAALFEIVSRAKEISLAKDGQFMKQYMAHISF